MFGDFVQEKDNSVNFSPTVTVTLDNPTLANGTLLCMVGNSTSPETKATYDGVDYFPVRASVIVNGSPSYFVIPTGAGGQTVIVFEGPSTTFHTACVAEFEGEFVFDQTADDNGTSPGFPNDTTFSTGPTPTTTVADEIIVGIMAANFVEPDAGTGFTKRTGISDGNGCGMAIVTKVVSATGTYDATATGGWGQLWDGAVFTYHAGGGGGGGIPVTVTFPTDAGGTGVVNRASLTSWDQVHDDVTGTVVTPTANAVEVGTQYLAVIPVWSIGRAFFPVDTSALPTGVPITAASLFVHGSDIAAGPEVGSYLVLVGPTTQGSPTTLAPTDYDQCDAVDGPTELSARILFADLAETGWNEFVLNSAGRALIDDAGFTLLGMRERRDTTDVSPDANTVNGFSFFVPAESGKEPYLSVTYLWNGAIPADLTSSIPVGFGRRR